MTRPPVMDNPRSDRIRAVAALGGRSARRRAGRILVEGPQSVRELIQFRPSDVIDVYISEDAEERDPELAQLAREVTQWVHTVTEDVSRAISKDSQGFAAVADEGALEYSAPTFWNELSAVSSTHVPFLVCLPEMQDPGNVGTIIRAADAMGAAAVVLGPGTVDPANPKVIRASAGSVFHLPLLHLPLQTVRANLPEDEWALLGTSGHDADIDLDSLLTGALLGGTAGSDRVLTRPHAWVIGNEARGLAAEDVMLCDLLVRIPIEGEAESLNAAAASAVCLYASHLGRTGGTPVNNK